MQQLPQVASASGSPWKIAIWFYHLKHDDGTTNWATFEPEQALGDINQYFDGLFEFSICGKTDINDDEFTAMNLSTDSPEFTDLMTYVDGLNQPLSENCVRIFLCSDFTVQVGNNFYGGYAFDRLMYNDAAAVFIGGPNSQDWAHELGHYFGLPHTFSNQANQYVNSPVTINGEVYTCLQTGDGFCDTPADLEFCASIDCGAPSCGSTDPLGVPYAPDPTLLMSYYDDCRNRFSDEQRQAMRILYLYHPNYAAIKDAPAECVIPKYGRIERNCVDIPGANDDISPVVKVPIEVRDVSNICDPQNNLTDIDGQYETEPCTLTGPLRRVLPDKEYGNDQLNGVSTNDLLLINKHIINADPFENPFQIIAADANNSGSVTSFDIVTIRKVILGYPGAVLTAGSWRYVPKICTETQSFIDQFYDGNPFDAVYTDPFQGFTRYYKSAGSNIPNTDSWMDHFSLVTTSSAAHNETAWSFTGIKVGDVDCGADIDGFVPESGDNEFTIQTGTGTNISSGAIKKIKVLTSVTSEVAAWQFGIRFASDSLTILDIQPGNTGTYFDEENFYHSVPAESGNNDGVLKSIWFAPDGNAVDLDGKVLYEIIIEADQYIGNLADVFKLDTRALDLKFYDAQGQAIPHVTLTLQLEDASFERSAPTRLKHDNTIDVVAYPIPFDSEITFEFSLPLEEAVDLTLFDAIGKPVSAFKANLPAGDQQLRLPAAGDYPPGLYWYSLKAGRYTAFEKIIKN